MTWMDDEPRPLPTERVTPAAKPPTNTSATPDRAMTRRRRRIQLRRRSAPTVGGSEGAAPSEALSIRRRSGIISLHQRIVSQEPRQSFTSVVQGGTHRSLAHAHGSGYIGIGKIERVIQDYCTSLSIG
jgi:hypothetical protein